MKKNAATIFELGKTGRGAMAQRVPSGETPANIPESQLRKAQPALPEVSELQVVRHYTNLSAKNFSIDNQFYPLGSCTMKYNPRGAHGAASLPGFLGRHLPGIGGYQSFPGCRRALHRRRG